MFEIYSKKEPDSIFSTFLIIRRNYEKILLIKNGVVCSLASQETKMMLPSYLKISSAEAIVGILPLFNGTEPNFFLLIVTSIQKIGEIGDTKYYQIQNVALIPFKNSEVSIHTILTNSQKQTANTIPPDDVIMAEFYKFITSGTFYYATDNSTINLTYEDISTSLQKRHQKREMHYHFLWNRVMRSFFTRTDENADYWVAYLICGSVEFTQHLLNCTAPTCGSSPKISGSRLSFSKKYSSITNLSSSSEDAKNEKFTIGLISRLSWQRMGVRYTCRGLDDDGNVANFAESEQIIFHNGKVSSYIQLRGTVPLFWEQTGFQMLGHKIDFSRAPVFSVEAMKRHFYMLKEEYGKYLTCVNLASLTKSSEASLGITYKDTLMLTDLPDVKIILFDFHEKCSGASKAENLEKLFEELQPTINKNGVYSSITLSGPHNNSYSVQNGAFRINCVDCIDRTNALQAYIGQDILEKQLNSIGIRNINSSGIAEMKVTIQKLWHKNGNACSKNYAGTDAMESGKSSLYSRLKDSALSVQRSCMNHFSDSSTGRNMAFSAFKTANQPSIMMPDLMRDRSYAYLPYHFRHHFRSTRVLVERLINRHEKYIVDVPLRLTIGTWNVNSGYKKNSESAFFNPTLSDWLLNSAMAEPTYTIDASCKDIHKEPDMIVIGLQELVDLNATNIIVHSSEQVMVWAKNVLAYITNNVNYTLICAEQLVGVGLIIFVKSNWIPRITDIRTCVVKTGMRGKTGNKGAILTSMLIDSSRFCFVSAHLAAGQSQTMQRNDDYNEIVTQYQAKTNLPFFNNDHIFWCGDLNYRIQLGIDEVKSAILTKDFVTLLTADQLKEAMLQNMAFSGFKEATILFDPTYKYDTNTKIYDTSEKCRIPAWCDRVLWFTKKKSRLDASGRHIHNVRPLYYGCCNEILSSDHRPVVATFDVKVEKVSRAAFVAEFENVLEEEKYVEPELSLESSKLIHKHHFEAVSRGLAEIMKDCLYIKVKTHAVGIKLTSGSNLDSYLRRDFVIDRIPHTTYILKPKVNKAVTYHEVEAQLLVKLNAWAAEDSYQLTRSEQSVIDMEKKYNDMSKSSIDGYMINRNCLLPQLPTLKSACFSVETSNANDTPPKSVESNFELEHIQNSLAQFVIPPVPEKPICKEPFELTEYPDFFQCGVVNDEILSNAFENQFNGQNTGYDSSFNTFGASPNFMNSPPSSSNIFSSAVSSNPQSGDISDSLINPIQTSSNSISIKRGRDVPPRPVNVNVSEMKRQPESSRSLNIFPGASQFESRMVGSFEANQEQPTYSPQAKDNRAIGIFPQFLESQFQVGSCTPPQSTMTTSSQFMMPNMETVRSISPVVSPISSSNSESFSRENVFGQNSNPFAGNNAQLFGVNTAPDAHISGIFGSSPFTSPNPSQFGNRPNTDLFANPVTTPSSNFLPTSAVATGNCNSFNMINTIPKSMAPVQPAPIAGSMNTQPRKPRMINHSVFNRPPPIHRSNSEDFKNPPHS